MALGAATSGMGTLHVTSVDVPPSAAALDVSRSGGQMGKSGDFGQTMFVWGVPEGSYVVMPYMGPATTRDAALKHLFEIDSAAGRAAILADLQSANAQPALDQSS